MSGHNSLPDGLNNTDNHDRIEAELRESIDVAAANGVTGLICFSGNRIPGVGDQEAIANTAAGLRRAAPYAEAKGVNLNLELLNSKVDHAGYQCDHSAWGLAVLEQVNSPNVKLLYDIYHMQIMEGDVIRTMTSNLDAIGHIHTAGNPGRNELDDNQELNYRGICSALIAAGYEGYVGHEFRPRGEVVASLRQAFELCNV
jgi:hydroxypyruvate isomerase